MEGLIPIHIRYGDKNSVLSQRLGYGCDALFAGVLYGNRSRVWGVIQIDINNVRRQRDLSKRGENECVSVLCHDAVRQPMER